MRAAAALPRLAHAWLAALALVGGCTWTPPVADAPPPQLDVVWVPSAPEVVRATFVEQDLFTTDVSPATVVTLYLLPELNERLRPKLLRELRPGARIVSHDFGIGDWLPEQTVEVLLSRTHRVFLWRIPRR